jgi:serine/threonine protein kinase/membrane-associated protease RseP (regulator of RpoE activity)
MFMANIQCPLCGKKIDINTDFNNEVTCPECQKSFNPARAKTANYDSSKIPTLNPETSPTDDEPILQSGAKLGQYEIKEMIGRGGMGTVYKAYQSILDRFVAIKILPAKLSSDPEFQKRFNREAKALAGLSHPNIITIYDMSREGNYYYFVMELVEGVTIRKLISEHKLPPPEALKIVPQLCDALEYAHSEGVVHRDIKPENILVDKNGRIKIADFGLARLVKGETGVDRVTKTNEVMGTFDYMAPEQRFSSKDVDHRVDIYSLGVVFYEMLTGELPIGKFELPSHMVHIDVRVDDVVLKTLEKEPSKRYQRAIEVGTAVTNIISGKSQYASETSNKIVIKGVMVLILSLIPTFISQIFALFWGAFIRAETSKEKPHPDAFYLSTAAIIISVFWTIAGFIFHLFGLWIGLLGAFLILLCLIIYHIIPSSTKPTPRYSLLSIVSLVFAFIPIVITQFISIALGIISLYRIKNSAGMLKGRGIAIAGIVVSIIMCIFYVLVLLYFGFRHEINAKGYIEVPEITQTNPPVISAFSNKYSDKYIGVIIAPTAQSQKPLSTEFIEKYKTSGVVIVNIEPDSPAERAALHEGDIILECNGKKVDTVLDLRNFITQTPVGDKLKLKVYRDDEEEIFDVVVADRIVQGTPFLGVTLKLIDKFLAFDYGFNSVNDFLKELKIDKADGFFVQKITPDSPAAKAGIQEGDILLTYNKHKLNSFEELSDLMKSSKVGENITLKIIRNGEEKLITVTLGEKKESQERDVTEQKSIELSKALEATNSIKDELTRDNTIYQISLQYAEIGEYDKAIEITKPITDMWKGQALVQIANIYIRTGHKSAEILNQALEVANGIKDEQAKSNVICQISIKYTEIGEYSRAIEIAKSIWRDQFKGQALTQIANIYIRTGHKSTEILNQALEGANGIKDEQIKSNVICQISIKYAEIGEYDRAIEIAKSIGNDQFKSNALTQISRLKTIRNK